MPGRRWSDGLHQRHRGQRERQDPERDPDPGHHHVPELLPHVQEALGHDRDRGHRGGGVPQDLRAGDAGHPDQQAHGQRDDQQDLIYKTEIEKFHAIVDDIVEANEAGKPVLVGTVSVEKSEVLSNFLKKKKIAHKVLNAKLHRSEADIVSQAGQLGAVTIATNMAGRGTDILLGGNPEFMARIDVAEAMGYDSDQQIADFAFLSGRCGPHQLRKARRPSTAARAGSSPSGRRRSKRSKRRPPEKGEKFIFPEDVPQTKSEARDQIYAERKEFYEEAVLRSTSRSCPSTRRTAVGRRRGSRTRAACASSAPSGTSRGASTTSFAAAPGRQGDPGSSRFYLSLEDDLMRIFGSEKMIRVMEALGMEDGVPIEHKMVTKSIANAQKRVEGMHFDSRKNLIEYDDVMNHQRKAIYSLRRQILDADPSREVDEGEESPNPELMRELVMDIAEDCIVNLAIEHCPEKAPPAEWKISEISKRIEELLGVHVDLSSARADRDDIMDRCFAEVERFYKEKEDGPGAQIVGQLSAFFYLQTIDIRWKGAPPAHGPPARGHPHAGLRPARSQAGVQEGGLPDVPGHAGHHPGRGPREDLPRRDRDRTRRSAPPSSRACASSVGSEPRRRPRVRSAGTHPRVLRTPERRQVAAGGLVARPRRPRCPAADRARASGFRSGAPAAAGAATGRSVDGRRPRTARRSSCGSVRTVSAALAALLRPSLLSHTRQYAQSVAPRGLASPTLSGALVVVARRLFSASVALQWAHGTIRNALTCASARPDPARRAFARAMQPRVSVPDGR